MKIWEGEVFLYVSFLSAVLRYGTAYEGSSAGVTFRYRKETTGDGSGTTSGNGKYKAPILAKTESREWGDLHAMAQRQLSSTT